MRQTLGDLLAVVRCAHLGMSPPHAMAFARYGAADAVRAFDRVVAPLLERTIIDSSTRAHAHDALLFASVKGGFLIYSYARMVRKPFPAEISALGGSFARLYDDLIDDVGGNGLEDRLSDLFHDRPFTPSNDLERLLEALYHTLRRRLNRPAADQIYTALHALHEFQTLSLRQRGEEISNAELTKITSGKGGYANVALFSLVQRTMPAEEWDLVMDLGEALQFLDDYVDVQTDLQSGIATPVTRGNTTLRQVVERLRELAPRILAHYGAGGRPFVTVLYALLVAAFVKRCRLGLSQIRHRRPRRPASPLGILLRHGDSVRPRRTGQVDEDPAGRHLGSA